MIRFFKQKFPQILSLLLHELNDLKFWLYAGVAIVFCWVAFLGWRPSYLIQVHDGVTHDFPFFQAVLPLKDKGVSPIYSIQNLGGVTMNFGIVWFYRILFWLKVPIQHWQNLFVFLLQVTLAYLSMKLSESFSLLSADQSKQVSKDWVSKVFQAIIFGFAPTLAWLFTYAHWVILLGFMVFFSVLTAVVGFIAGNGTGLLVLVCIGVISANFQIIHQQAFIYGLLFGVPVLLGVFFPSHLNSKLMRQAFFIPLVLIFSGMALALWDFDSLLEEVFSREWARFSEVRPAVYEYMVGEWTDWLSSLTWGYSLFLIHRPMQLRHEVNYVLGPPLMFLLGFSWKKMRFFGIGLLLSSFLILVFSVNFKPFSTWIIQAVPLLNHFRVPMRAALLLALLLPPLAVSVIQTQCEANLNLANRSLLGHLKIYLSWMAGFLCLGLISKGWREAGFFISFGVGFFVLRKNKLFQNYLGSSWLWLGLMAFGSILGFKERMLPPLKSDYLTKHLPELSKEILKLAPELKCPLVRANIQFPFPNLGMYLGISSLSGYMPPFERYLRLLAGLGHYPYASHAMAVGPAVIQSLLPVLKDLYNIRYHLSWVHKKVSVSKESEGLNRPVWFPETVHFVDSYPELGEELWKLSQVPGGLFQSAAVLKESQVAFYIEDRIDPSCRLAEVKKWEVDSTGQKITIHYDSPARCLLVLSTNFSRTWVASLWDAEDKLVLNSASLFPVYGALTGVWVSPEASLLKMSTMRDYSIHLWLSQIAGLFLGILGCYWMVFRSQKV